MKGSGNNKRAKRHPFQTTAAGSSGRKDIDDIIKARLALISLSGTHTIEEVLRHTLDELEKLTGSKIGFYHFLLDDQKTVSLQAWSSQTQQIYCRAEGRGLHYDIDRAGIWVDCVRKGRPVIHNDYMNAPGRKGLPEGHADIVRELVVPVIRNGKIVAILGVGNKDGLYDDDDVQIASTFADLAWDIAELKIQENERNLLELKLYNAQKMESMARMAGNLAHDFNNLLTPVLTYGEMLRDDLTDKTQRKRVENIISAAHRCRTLSRQLMYFAGKQEFKAKAADINKIIAGYREMIQSLIGKNITLKVIAGAENGIGNLDRGQVEQLIMNLVVNSADAMRNGGSLIIETRNESLDAALASRQANIPPGKYVVLSVSDTGTGIGEDIIDRVFEPFFTTKAGGKGTGLGLSIVHGIAKKHKAYITVMSSPASGTSVSIYFPLSNQRPEPEKTADMPDVSGLKGSETVIVVDDEETVKTAVCQMLMREGYTILHASGFDEAANISRSHAGAIDLLLTDFMMPGRTGMDLYSELRKDRPGLKVLFMSGYAKKKISMTGAYIDKDDFISKPFTKEELLTKMRKKLIIT